MLSGVAGTHTTTKTGLALDGHRRHRGKIILVVVRAAAQGEEREREKKEIGRELFVAKSYKEKCLNQTIIKTKHTHTNTQRQWQRFHAFLAN